MTNTDSNNRAWFLSQERVYFVENELSWRTILLRDLSGAVLDEIRNSTSPIILNVGNSISEIKALDNYKLEKCVWLWLYGDETFNPILNFHAISHKYVKGIIRPYPLSNSSLLSNLKSCISFVLSDTIKKRSWKLLVKYTAASFIRIIRMAAVSILHNVYSKKNINFEPGYTNLFANAIALRFRDRNQSKSLIKLFQENSGTNLRKYGYCFIGQTGNSSRIFAIETLLNFETKSKKLVQQNKVFGGTIGSNGATLQTAQEYVDALQVSRFTLCPAGNYSGATFRWLESIILGSIPIVSTRIPSDPSFDTMCRYALSANRTWSHLLGEAEKMSENEEAELVEKLRHDFVQKIIELNETIAQP